MTVFRALADRFNALPAVIRGVFWMAFSSTSFALMIVFVRLASKEFSTFEIMFWRALFALAIMVPWLARAGLDGIRTERLALHISRNAVHFFGIAFWFWAVATINLAQGMALSFTMPLFVIILVVAFFGEKVDWQRWTATLVGFGGVMIILRPGMIEVTLPALAVLASTLFYAISTALTKPLARTESGNRVVFYMHATQTPMALVPALFAWTWPALADLPALLGVGLTASLAHYGMTRAFNAADTSVVMPVDFVKLPLVAVFGFWFFGEVPEIWAWVGGAVIFTSVYYITWREARLKRAQRRAATPASEEAAA